MANIEQLKEIHRHCAAHRHLVERANICGCFHCTAVFPAAEIDIWCDDPDGGLTGTTAICPRCGIDSVLPDNIPGVELSPSLLSEMRHYWFDS